VKCSLNKHSQFWSAVIFFTPSIAFLKQSEAMKASDTIAYWLPIYIERFGDSVNLISFNSEADCVAAIKEALETDTKISEPPDGIVL
jgi:hypothetical protein